jgi:hypothetical protein
MNQYTFKSPYGNYTFSDTQIEGNQYLSREQKDIMLGLAAWQSNKPASKPSKYMYDVYEDGPDKPRELVKTPYEYEFYADLDEKRWYETVEQFAKRKAKEYERKNTVKVKEVKREKVTAERSTFSDGTKITKWDANIKYFL